MHKVVHTDVTHIIRSNLDYCSIDTAIIPDGACPGSSPHARTTTNRLALCFRTDFEPTGAFGRPGASDTEIACLGMSSQSPRPLGVAYWPHNRREGQSQQRNDAFLFAVCDACPLSTMASMEWPATQSHWPKPTPDASIVTCVNYRLLFCCCTARASVYSSHHPWMQNNIWTLCA